MMCSRLSSFRFQFFSRFSFFFFNNTSPSEVYTLSLHDALPIFSGWPSAVVRAMAEVKPNTARTVIDFFMDFSLLVRSEEHTSELQSPYDLVCRLLLEKKKKEKTLPAPEIDLNLSRFELTHATVL